MKNYISALLIALGLLALGLCVRSGIKSISANNNIVAVRGLAEREVQANKVTWPLVVKVVGNDMVSIYSQIESLNKQIVTFLTSNGITKEEYSVNAPDVTDNQANSYVNQEVPYRYNVTSVITVTSTKVDLVRSLIARQGELLKQGVAVIAGDYQYQTIYEYTGLNEIKPEMIAEATKNAREAAEKFAADSGSKVGKIKNAQQGQFSIEDRDPYTPYIKKVRVVTYVDYAIND